MPTMESSFSDEAIKVCHDILNFNFITMTCINRRLNTESFFEFNDFCLKFNKIMHTSPLRRIKDEYL